MSGHQSPVMKTDSWLTPPEWIEKLGRFALDPCCPPDMPWKTAYDMMTKADDGFNRRWIGRVWLNPPFGREAAKWLAKLADHGDGIALIPARTETEMFYDHVWRRASAVCFVKGRPHFHYPDGKRAPFNSGAPIALVAYGAENAAALEKADLGITLHLHGKGVVR